ncbi:hypothetical protein JIG36_18475 [Actinoplanes sp. LDG1-06]|uniref:Uncharacterized protein n=1 Tax=Paractinoplanes ovalisporus TaxID=2810368 RepID=A0ABS2ACJ1_9ACTN|nr:hypothetical protein [Actinoplanes ovalisporus]MBM2617544.1 hypothetical protein [Actinoplanes ovalisporus]
MSEANRTSDVNPMSEPNPSEARRTSGTNPSEANPMSVNAELFRIFRPLVLWIAAIMIAVEVTAVVAILSVNPMPFSFWLVVVGAMAKYWPLVAGILLISMHFRLFLANGFTRHEYLRGVAVFGLAVVLAFPAVVVLGHGVESTVLGLLDQRGDGYPLFRFGDAAAEYLHVLPATAGYLASGILISAGFYRFRPWIAVPLIAPGALPGLVADGLIRIDEHGALTQNLPFALAFTLSVAATLAAGIAVHRVMRDVAVKRTAG